ncbi:DUF6207 family protein [Streptomyces sp. NPDC048219]|uniref:DUF6207 family protein n=1 Tax=unclassified Streptomyces TaxID=2593676 RepID=UPI0034126AC3
MRRGGHGSDQRCARVRARPGRLDVAAADDETAFAFHAALAARWATRYVERTTRDAGQAGVRLRCYLDLLQPLNPPGTRGGAW